MNNMDIIKSPNDRRNFRYIKLQNDLEALLISDQETSIAAVSLSVGVGSLQDDIEGIKKILMNLYEKLMKEMKSSPLVGDVKNWTETFSREPFLDDMKKKILTKRIQFWKEKLQL